MFIKITQNPVASPVNVNYLMSYLRAPLEDQDLVKKLAFRAMAAFTQYTSGNVIGETVYDVYFDYSELLNTIIRLPVRPVKSIDSITFFDDDGSTTELETTDFIFISGDHEFQFASNLVVEGNVRDRRSVKVTLTAGRDTTTTEPDILAGIEQYVVYLYENRGDSEIELSDSIKTLWSPYIIHSFGVLNGQ